MSRIGKKPVLLPKGITIEFSNDKLTVKGPLGEITKNIHPDISLDINEEKIVVVRNVDDKFHRALIGTIRSIISNMVVGVTEGFKKELIIEGMGYKAELKGDDLNIVVGFSHPVLIKKEDGIAFIVEGNNRIVVNGIDKEKVGQVAAEIRAFRPPEPYKGKGIRYKDERVRRKAGKIAI
ncbi:50S ribosomal protein L6 [candidate division WOR-3 bacterium]|nr:50S ribosomal protein L6 [candidate division WOR-3 bacterium]MCK4575228.1 50S ribosomal protein L6 [candidate division WOR-3 bacterium]